MAGIPRMRTKDQAAQHYRSLDPETSLTAYHIGRLMDTGVIPTFRSGRRKLINLDVLDAYLRGKATTTTVVSDVRRIRKVDEK